MPSVDARPQIRRSAAISTTQYALKMESWKAINVTMNVHANVVIHIGHVNIHKNQTAKRMSADRQLAATPSESDPKQGKPRGNQPDLQNESRSLYPTVLILRWSG